LGHLTYKNPVRDVTYNVFSGTLNPTQSIEMVFFGGRGQVSEGKCPTWSFAYW